MYQADFIMEGRLHLNYFDGKWSYLHRISLPDTTIRITKPTPITKTEAFAFPYKTNEFNKYEIIQQGDSITIKVNDKYCIPLFAGSTETALVYNSVYSLPG